MGSQNLTLLETEKKLFFTILRSDGKVHWAHAVASVLGGCSQFPTLD